MKRNHQNIIIIIIIIIYVLIERISILNAFYMDKKKKENKKNL